MQDMFMDRCSVWSVLQWFIQVMDIVSKATVCPYNQSYSKSYYGLSDLNYNWLKCSDVNMKIRVHNYNFLIVCVQIVRVVSFSSYQFEA